MPPLLTWLIDMYRFDPLQLLITAMVGMLWFLIRSIVKIQYDSITTLSNHMNEIRKGLENINTHMATSNTILQGMLDRVLNAALKRDEK